MQSKCDLESEIKKLKDEIEDCDESYKTAIFAQSIARRKTKQTRHTLEDKELIANTLQENLEVLRNELNNYYKESNKLKTLNSFINEENEKLRQDIEITSNRKALEKEVNRDVLISSFREKCVKEDAMQLFQ